MKRWQCVLCGFVYDEALDCPRTAAPGTRWEDVAQDWSCPDCAATKAAFSMVEV